jgi:hypothetical protein
MSENRKYQFMEANNQRRARGLRDKIPDIQKTLDTVQFLQKRDVSFVSIRTVEESLAGHKDRVNPLFPPQQYRMKSRVLIQRHR